MYADKENCSKSNILLHVSCLLFVNVNLCMYNQRQHVENGHNLPINKLFLMHFLKGKLF